MSAFTVQNLNWVKDSWLHKNLKTDIYKYHLGKYFIIANILAIGFIIPLSLLCYVLDFRLGIIACLVQLLGHLASFLYLRISDRIGLNCYLALSNFAIVLLIMSAGVGSVASIFSIYYVILIWFAFYYDHILGMIWTTGLLLWLMLWIYLEYTGLVQFELGMTVSNFIIFKYFYLTSSLVMAAIIFCSNKLNENGLRLSIESSKKALLASEKLASLGQLTAGVAHEINNPINFVSGNAQALKMDFEELAPILTTLNNLEEQADNPKQVNQLISLAKSANTSFLLNEINELIDGINNGSDRITEIVSGLRMFAHQSEEKFIKYDLSKIIDSALIILKNKMNQKDITIKKEYSDLELISCLPGKLQQAFINIINNSIEAVASNGAIDITISQIDRHLVSVIRDNGIGMDNETMDKMFDPFYTTKEIGEGTGLGLSISHGIIKNHGGSIEISSKVNHGAEVVITLPIS